MKNSNRKIVITVCLALLLTACGGGGSSSGGGVADSPVVNRVFSGSYSTPLYSGSITVTVNANNNVIDISGVECIGEAIGMLQDNINGNDINILGNIGNTTDRFGDATAIDVRFDSESGSGSIALNPPAPCFSSVGTVSVSLQ